MTPEEKQRLTPLDAPTRPKEPPKTPRCPECGGAMLVKTGKSGDFLSCLRYPDCKGRKNLESPLPVVPGEDTPKLVNISPILYLTGCAIEGLLANPNNTDMHAGDVSDTAIQIARQAIHGLKNHGKRKNADS